MARRESSAGLLLEGLVILFSVLGAFLLEGWREDRATASTMAEDLGSIEAELGRNRDMATAHLNVLERALAGIEEVIRLSYLEPGGSHLIVPDTLAWLATSLNPTLNPSLGATDALIASGRLARVRNPELRLGLAGLRDLFTDAMEDDVGGRSVQADRFSPAATEAQFDTRPLMRLSAEFFRGSQAGRSSQEQWIDRAVPTYGDLAFPNTVAVRNALVAKYQWYQGGVSEYRGLVDHLNDLVGLVVAEQGQVR